MAHLLRVKEPRIRNTRHLYVVTAVIEAVGGLALLASPSEVIAILFGVVFDTPIELAVGRWVGVALLSLGVACWRARHDEKSSAGKALVSAMLFYNAAIIVLLAWSRMASGLEGVAFWPAAVLHTAMTAWCIACLAASS